MSPRRQTRSVSVGGVQIGGGAPISVQTMANADPHDAGALLRQTEACAALGCDIMRLAVPDRDQKAHERRKHARRLHIAGALHHTSR